jgi:hypothetical protein
MSLKLYLKIVPQIVQKNPRTIGFFEEVFARFEVKFDLQQIVPQIVPVFWGTEPAAMSTGTIYFTQKHKNIPFLPENRYLWRSAWHSIVQGSRHTWTLQKKHSFKHSFFPATQLSCCCHCLHLLCCRVANTVAADTVGMPPPPPPPLIGEEDDACYTNANSSPATSAHAVCRALESRALLDRPLPAGHAGNKGSDNDGGTDSGG